MRITEPKSTPVATVTPRSEVQTQPARPSVMQRAQLFTRDTFEPAAKPAKSSAAPGRRLNFCHVLFAGPSGKLAALRDWRWGFTCEA
jgi:hypothetical protein